MKVFKAVLNQSGVANEIPSIIIGRNDFQNDNIRMEYRDTGSYFLVADNSVFTLGATFIQFGQSGAGDVFSSQHDENDKIILNTVSHLTNDGADGLLKNTSIYVEVWD